MSSTSAAPARGGLTLILVATVLAGIGGYAITSLAARGLGDEYGVYAVFWSALYLLIGALSGVQQEVTRATQHRGRGERQAGRARIHRLALGITGVVLVLVLGSSPLWALAIFPGVGLGLAVPLSVGVALYVLVATAMGAMYGARMWRPLAVAIVLDVALRLLFVGIALLLGAPLTVLAWATVVPLPLVVGTVLVITRGRVLRATELDVGYPGAISNIARTILAAASTGLLVSGFPLLLGVTSRGLAPALLSAVIFALTLTRAPLVVTTLALQGYFIVHFRDATRSVPRAVLAIMAGIAAIGAVLALVAGWIGSDVIVLIAGETFRLQPWFVGLLVATSVSTGWLAITGTAVLARGQHTAYTAGWLAAALAAVGLLLVPGDVLWRSLLALGVGPLPGLVIHLVALGRPARPLELPDPQVL